MRISKIEDVLVSIKINECMILTLERWRIVVTLADALQAW